MKKALVKQFTAAELIETKSQKNQAVQSTSDTLGGTKMVEE